MSRYKGIRYLTTPPKREYKAILVGRLGKLKVVKVGRRFNIMGPSFHTLSLTRKQVRRLHEIVEEASKH